MLLIRGFQPALAAKDSAGVYVRREAEVEPHVRLCTLTTGEEVL